MARSIDEKIVQLKLDDAGFADKVKIALSRFADLDSGLTKVNNNTVDNASKSVSGIGDSAKKSSSALDSIAASLDGLNSKFSAWGVAAATVISNVTTSITNMGARVAKEATFQPLIDGYNEYTNKLKSINVIMNNVPGAQLADVKNTLGELNTYADKTIYSFEDMTTNMGTFTAAGVSLNDSAVAIQGIGNLAASSGSSTQQMSMAMYQLSQALASGKVGLQDWNSVVNAGMGGQKFQKALSETAKELGHGRNEAVSFRDSLQDGWLTSEVLLKTLEKFKNDKSMETAATQVKSFADLIDTTKEGLGSAWAQVWENIIGDSEEAPKLWTGVAEAIQKPISAMDNYNKTVSKEFHDMGGRQAVINGLGNVFESLGKILGAVGKAFANVFPPATGQMITNMAKNFENFTKTLRISKEDVKNIQDAFQGFFTVVKWGLTVVGAIAKVLIGLIPRNLFSMIEAIAGSFGRFIIAVDKGATSAKGFGGVANALGAAVNGVRTALEAVINFFTGFINGTNGASKAVQQVMSNIGKSISEFKGSISSGASNVDYGKIFGIGAVLVIANTIRNVGKSFTGVLDSIKKFTTQFSGIGKQVSKVFDQVGDAIKVFTASVKVDILLRISAALGLLAVALKIISTIDGQSIFKSLFTVAAALTIMTRAMAALSLVGEGGVWGSTKLAINALSIQILAESLLLLSASLVVISLLKPEDIAKSLVTLGVVLQMLMSALDKMGGSGKSAQLLGSAAALVVLAGALQGITIAIAALAFIPLAGVAKGVGAIGLVLAELSAFMKVMGKAQFSVGQAAAITVIAVAINLMVAPIAALSTINFQSLVQSLGGMAVLLAEIALFSKAIKGSDVSSAAAGLLVLSLALNGFAVAVAIMSEIKLADLGVGLLGLASALGVAVLATKLIGSGSDMAAGKMLVLAGALLVFSGALKVLSSIPLADLGVGLAGLAGSLAIILAAGAIAGLPLVAAGLTVLAVAMAAISGAVALFSVSIGILASGLALLAASGAAGAYAFAASIKAISGALVEAAPQFGAFLAGAVASFITGLLGMMTQIATAIAQGLIDIMNTIAEYGPQIIESFTNMIVSILDSLAENAPRFAESATNFIVSMAAAIGDNAPMLIEAAIQLVIDLANGLAQGIRDNAPAIVDAVVNVIESILELVIEALEKVLNLLLGWIPGFTQMTSGAGDAAKEALRGAFGIDEVAGKKADGATQAINDKTSGFKSATTTMGLKGMEGIEEMRAKEVGSKKGQDFTDGVSSKSGESGAAGKKLAKSAEDSATGDFKGKGEDAGSGFVKGIGNWLGAAWDAGAKLASAAMKAIKSTQNSNSPSKETMKLGGYAADGYSLGISDGEQDVADSASNLAQTALDNMAGVGQSINDAMMSNINDQPVITPVIDDSQLAYSDPFQDGSLALNGNIGYSGYSNPQQSAPSNNTTVNSSPTFNITQRQGESSQDLVNRIEGMLNERTYQP